MTSVKAYALSRRGFLAGTCGFVLSVTLPIIPQASEEDVLPESDAAVSPILPNAFIRVGADNSITVLIKHFESGQGPWTGLATLVAEEMDADWSQIRAEHAPTNHKLYGNPYYGDLQVTGGSTSMAASFELMRKAGAAARAMLIAAAADTWGVPAGALTIEKGIITHAQSRRSATFGTFAEAAANQAVPDNPPLKSPDQFIYIGKSIPKVDTAIKLTGAAIYTLDIYREAMQTVVVRHPDHFGASVASVDDTAARMVPGCNGVKPINSGVAIYADNSFAALKARKLLDVKWDMSNAETRSSEDIIAECVQAVQKTGAIVQTTGDAAAAFANAQTVVEAEYVFPFLAHAPMEPLDAIFAPSEDGGIDVWMGSQNQTTDQQVIASVCGVAPEQVNLVSILAGGSFGRRAQQESEFAKEAAEVFMADGGQRPIKLMWTREDDIRGGFYRPIVAHKLRGGLDAAGEIIAWDHCIAGHSFMKNSPWEDWIVNGVDPILVEGGLSNPYDFRDSLVTCHIIDTIVPVLWWRSNGFAHGGYAIETFLDELLEKSGKDLVEGRLALMTKNERLAATLRRAAEMADWGRDMRPGHALGVAAIESYNTCVAHVAEVSLDENGQPKIHTVWCAVDCGLAVNPEIIRAQMEGGIGFGLSAMLFNELTLDPGGRINQSNFHDYRSLRISEMPDVHVTIMPSAAPPVGVGEPCVPPIGPAVANAVRRLTGKSIRRLPMINALPT